MRNKKKLVGLTAALAASLALVVLGFGASTEATAAGVNCFRK